MRSTEWKQYEEAANHPIVIGDRVWVKGKYQFEGEVTAIFDSHIFLVVKTGTHLHVSVGINDVVRLPR